MKLLLDTANLEQIKRFMPTGTVAGVTTNPSLMAKEAKGNYLQKLKDIANAVKPISGTMHLSVEVTTLDPKAMFAEALGLEDFLGETGLDLHIKIPVMFDTLSVISNLRKRDVKVNATACMTAMQAKLASDAGAHIVSFFYNRILDGNEDANLVLDTFHSMKTQNVKVICGSIRKPEDIQKCWFNGADFVTASPAIIEKMISHPQTDKAIKQFQEDIDKWLS